tara:strand:+ start:458 stop:682 length:225 start_codon:yes stop_codon:yes gene_type:complete
MMRNFQAEADRTKYKNQLLYDAANQRNKIRVANTSIGGDRTDQFSAGGHTGCNLEKNSISSIASGSNRHDSLED